MKVGQWLKLPPPFLYPIIGEKKDLEKELPSDTVNHRRQNLRASKNWVHRNNPTDDMLSRRLVWSSSVSSAQITL